MKLRNQMHVAALAGSLALLTQAAQAVETDWDIDLTGLDGTTVGAVTYDNFGSLTGLLDITISGSSKVKQTLVGGSGAGQPFKESGYLDWVGATYSGGTTVPVGTFANFIGDNDVTGNNFIYFEWVDLTGVSDASGNGDIHFDTGAGQLGSVGLYLDAYARTLAGVPFDGNAGTIPTTRLLLATFDVVPLSGGSGIGIDGGAFPSGTVGLTLDVSSLLAGVKIYDDAGNLLTTDTLFKFVDVDATIATPATIVVDENGDGYFIQQPIEHDGSWVVTTVPVPAPLALMGAGLVAIGWTNRKWLRSAKAA